MAYKRFARRRVRRRQGRKHPSKLAKIAKIVNRTKPTTKVYQSIVAGYISNRGLVATSGNCASIFNTGNGTTFEDRQNPVVHVSKVEIGGYIATSDSSTICRALLYTGPDSSLPLSVFQLGQGSPAAPVAPRQPSKLCDQQYKILWDSGPLPMGVTGGLMARRALRKTVDLKGMKIGFGNSTGSTVPDYHPLIFTIMSQDVDGVTTNTSHSTDFQVFFSS